MPGDTGIVGTALYLAPELLKNVIKYSQVLYRWSRTEHEKLDLNILSTTENLGCNIFSTIKNLSFNILSATKNLGFNIFSTANT